MKKVIRIIFWCLFGISTVLLLSFSSDFQRKQIMSQPTIYLEIQDGIALMTEEELLQKLKTANLYHNKIKKEDLDISAIENFIANLNEVEKVEVFSELGEKWFIKTTIKRPVARILKNNGNGFYIDSNGKLMKLTPGVKPRILTFTGVENIKDSDLNYSKLINNDSLITKNRLSDIYRISSYVCNDAFYDAQIVQVHFTNEDGFILIPRVGKHEIIFGMANSDEVVARKFKQLTTFYEEVIPYEGWDKYKSINLKFDNQIVAKKNK